MEMVRDFILGDSKITVDGDCSYKIKRHLLLGRKAMTNLFFFESCSVMSNALRPYRLYSPWNFTDQNTGMGSLSLLQAVIPTQGLNPGLPLGPHIKKQRHYLANKGPSSQRYGFSSSHIWM